MKKNDEHTQLARGRLSRKAAANSSVEERELGIDVDITRRDFLNTVALGTGTALLVNAAPSAVKALDATDGTGEASWHPWTGFGGVGDYAISNGNTWEVVTAGHAIRDGLDSSRVAAPTDTGETYDLVVVGGGFSGTIAAYTFLKETRRERSCLILDNHPLIGGEAKRNEFLVRGQRLIGPQGSNGTDIPKTGWRGQLWRDIGLPFEFECGQLPSGRRRMEFPLLNYEDGMDPSAAVNRNHGFFFEAPHSRWVTNPWAHGLQGTPWSPALRRDLLRWRDEPAAAFEGDDLSLKRWLDTMTYEDYLVKVRKLHPEVARYVDPILAAAEGLGSDALSACLAYRGGFPGFRGLSKETDALSREQQVSRPSAKGRLGMIGADDAFSFPGGNDGILRALVKWLNPAAIEGTASFADVHNGRIRFDAMDKAGIPCRMRSGATVVHVAHDPERKRETRPAAITYLKEGRLYTVQARTVIWAAASWSGKHVIQHLPVEYRKAMEGFPRSPMLVVNVALNNWRALYKLGYSACSWRGGFGFSGSIRAPMYVGSYRPPLDPDQPTIFTLYVPFPQRGLPLVEQGRVARAKLYASSYRDFELQIRRQLATLFANSGFDPKRDIAGIVLNRWGHAYANAGPGFFYGRNGMAAPSDVLRRPLGNLTFAHTELAGIAAWWNAGEEGVRAARQVLAML